MSAVSRTDLEYPFRATAIMARPSCFVVVNIVGARRRRIGYSGLMTAYIALYQRVDDRIPWSGMTAPGRNMYAALNGIERRAFSVRPFTRAHIVLPCSVLSVPA